MHRCRLRATCSGRRPRASVASGPRWDAPLSPGPQLSPGAWRATTVHGLLAGGPPDRAPSSEAHGSMAGPSAGPGAVATGRIDQCSQRPDASASMRTGASMPAPADVSLCLLGPAPAAAPISSPGAHWADRGPPQQMQMHKTAMHTCNRGALLMPPKRGRGSALHAQWRGPAVPAHAIRRRLPAPHDALERSAATYLPARATLHACTRTRFQRTS